MSAKQLDKQLDFDKGFLKEEAMTIDLDSLEPAAKAATPGPWIDIEEDDENFGWGIHYITTQNRLDNSKGGIARIETDFNPPVEKEQKANAAYIAAVSPDVVLELIAELRRTRLERDWLVRAGQCCAYTAPSRGICSRL